MRREAAILLAMALSMAGCRTQTVIRGGVEVPVETAVAADLDAARVDLGELRPEEARERLENLVQEIPGGPRNVEVFFLLGETYRELGQLEPAIASYRTVVGRRSKSSFVPLAHLRLGELYRATGRPELARRALARAPFARAEREVRVRLYLLLAELTEEAGQIREAVRWLAYARRDVVESAEVEELDGEIDRLVRGSLLDLELERLTREVPRGPVRDRIFLELASRSLEQGDLSRAEKWITKLPRSLLPEEEERRNDLLIRLRQDVVGPGAPIGVALPLSGPYANYGWSVLRGIVLGLGTYEDPPGPFRLHVRDTAGELDDATRAVRELFSESAVAVIGPLRSSTSAAAAPVAEEGRIPLLTLSRREDLAFLGSWVFRLGVTQSDQARVLVQHAIADRGMRRFAILHPKDDYGRAFKNLFWEEVERQGGSVVGVEGYEADAIDVQAPIRKLVGLFYVTEEEQELIDEKERLARRPLENAERLAEPELADLPPYVDFDALFVPDVASKVGLIFPQLRFYDVNEVLLLGPSGWNDRSLIDIAGRDAEGAIFTDTFFLNSELAAVEDFVAAYYAAYGDEPDALAAEGYDAASMLRRVLPPGAARSRTRVREALLRIRDFAGVSGVASFDDVGGTLKSLYLLTVRNGSIVEHEEQY